MGCLLHAKLPNFCKLERRMLLVPPPCYKLERFERPVQVQLPISTSTSCPVSSFPTSRATHVAWLGHGVPLARRVDTDAPIRVEDRNTGLHPQSCTVHTALKWPVRWMLLLAAALARAGSESANLVLAYRYLPAWCEGSELVVPMGL